MAERENRSATDILVVGAGTAGLTLALCAARSGAQVRVLEKSNRIGGTLFLTSGMFSAGGSRLQKERGIEDSPQGHFNDVIRISRDTVRREMVRLYCDLAPGMVDWLQDEGFEFHPQCPVIFFGHEPYGQPRTYWGVNGGSSYLELLNRGLEPHLSSGRVQIELNSPVERLLLEEGVVVGVAAGDRSWRAGNVVLTTGGYSSNPDMVARFTGDRRLVSIGAETATGDGIAMGEAAGATVTGNQFFLPTFAGLEDPDRPGRVYQRAPDTWDANARLQPQLRPAWEIWVNANGERFIREDDPSVDTRERTLLEQPDMRFWIVFNERILAESPPLYMVWTADELRTMANEGKLAQRADSLDELAGKMEVPEAALSETVADYNDGLATGRADRLARMHRPLPVNGAPYYAIRQQGIVLRTWPGLEVDTEMRVLGAGEAPIPGLFAVGETLGAHTFSGDSFAGGMSFGPAIALAKYLGERLANRSSAQEKESASRRPV